MSACTLPQALHTKRSVPVNYCNYDHRNHSHANRRQQRVEHRQQQKQKKIAAETTRQEHQRHYLKTDQNYLVVEHDACSKFLGLRAHSHFKITLGPPYLLGVFFLENMDLVAVFYPVPACIFLQCRKLLDLEKRAFMF